MSDKTKRIIEQSFFIGINLFIILWVSLFLTLNMVSVSGKENGVSLVLTISGYDYIFGRYNEELALFINYGIYLSTKILFILIAVCIVYAVRAILETETTKKTQATEKALALLFSACLIFLIVSCYVIKNLSEGEGMPKIKSEAWLAVVIACIFTIVYFVLKKLLLSNGAMIDLPVLPTENRPI